MLKVNPMTITLTLTMALWLYDLIQWCRYSCLGINVTKTKEIIDLGKIAAVISHSTKKKTVEVVH